VESARLDYSLLDDLTPVIFVTTGGEQASYSAGVHEGFVCVFETNRRTGVPLEVTSPGRAIRYPDGVSLAAVMRRLERHEYTQAFCVPDSA